MRVLTITAALLATLSLGRAEIILQDDFEDGEIITPTQSAAGAAWIVDSGKFAADGSEIGNYRPASGQLNFGIDPKTSIRIDYGPVVEGSPVTAKLDLRQSNVSNASHRIDIILKDKVTKQEIVLGCSPNAEFFNTSGFALFDGTGNLLLVGLEGAHLKADDQWQNLSISVDPSFGVTITQDDVTILTFNGSAAMMTPDRLIINSTSGGVSWFVKNVEVDTTLDQVKLKAAGNWSKGR